MSFKWNDATFVQKTLLVLLLAIVVNCLEHSEIQATGKNCPGRDNCFINRTANAKFFDVNCECDTNCHKYNDCCIDAPRRPSRDRSPSPNVTCLLYNVTYFAGAYVINKCQRNWIGSTEVKRKCEIMEDLSDPLIAAPATDVGGRISYKNRYCAECNNVNLERLVTWSVSINCDTFMLDSETNSVDNKTAYMMQHLTYEASQNKWGVNYWSSRESRNTFYPCDLSFVLPSYLENSTRLCRGNLISNCAPNWVRISVRRKCEAYTAVVYANNKSYRNPHCALCNRVDMSAVICSSLVLGRNKPALSFTLLLDVNMSDGNRVGLTRDQTECPSGQKWDPFFKKCRRLVCALPGYEMVNGRCTRQSK